MKKKILIIIVLLFVSMIIFAQSDNNEQRIIGTWENGNEEITITFNADGTMSGYIDSSELTRYVIADNLLILYADNNYPGYQEFACEYRISSDGRTLIIIFFGGWFGEGFSFTRK